MQKKNDNDSKCDLEKTQIKKQIKACGGGKNSTPQLNEIIVKYVERKQSENGDRKGSLEI